MQEGGPIPEVREGGGVEAQEEEGGAKEREKLPRKGGVGGRRMGIDTSSI